MSTLGQRIREFRRSRKYTQRKFAEKIGCVQSAVAQWENNTRVPAFEALYAMRKAFGLSIDNLIDNITL